MKIVTGSISINELKTMAEALFGDMVKAVVDIKRSVMAVGGELHADEEALLMAEGSGQADLWGINIYPDKKDGDFIEYDSMINLRPAHGNRTRGVEQQSTRKAIASVVEKLVAK